MLGTGRCTLTIFRQHDAPHQIGVDPIAEAAIRTGDDLAAGDRGVRRMRSATFEAVNVHEHEWRVWQNIRYRSKRS